MVGEMPTSWVERCANEGVRLIPVRPAGGVVRAKTRLRLSCRCQPESQSTPFTTTMQRVHIEIQNQFGGWLHVQTLHHQGNAYCTAKQRARSSRKRHRLVDDNGHLLDLIEP